MMPLIVIILLQNAMVLQISTPRQNFRKSRHKPRDFKELAPSCSPSTPFDCCIVRHLRNFPLLRLDDLISFV